MLQYQTKNAYVANMEEYIREITLKTRQQNKGSTTTNDDDTEG